MSFPYNRKDRLKIAHKTKSKVQKVNWNASNAYHLKVQRLTENLGKIEKRIQRDKEFLESVDVSNIQNNEKQNVWSDSPKLGNQCEI